jgi:ABC-type multidrug transport system ATPase subunit
VVNLESVSVSFGRSPALTNVSMRVPEVGLLGIVGPNGAGKSTLLDVLAGFLRPSSGYVRASGSETRVAAIWLLSRSVRLHQTRVLPEGVSVAEYLALARSPSNSRWLLGAMMRAPLPPDPEVQELLASVGVSASSPLGALSWGQARVTALAAVLLAPKRLVLLDEPFAGLSAPAAAACRDVLRRTARDRPVVCVEHDLDNLFAVADTVAQFAGGRLTRVDSVSDFSRDRFLQQFSDGHV